MTRAYFAFGTTLANMVNVENYVTHPPHVLPRFGGLPMPLQGGVGRRVLSGKLRRSGYASGRWMFSDFEDDYDDLNALLLALYGDFTTSSRELYISTLDSSNHYSPFLCHVDCPYIGQSHDLFNDHPTAVGFDLIGGVLQALTKSANYTVTTSDHHISVDTSGGSRTMSLPALSGVNQNVVYSFVKTSASNNLVLDPNSSETIDGASTKTVTALNARVDIVSNGTQWVSI